MVKVLDILSKIKIVPVVMLDDVQKAVPLAKALLNGGIPCAEITFRTGQAAECIKAVSTEMPRLLVGAGTVLTCRQADDAVAAGAKFIVSPGFNPKVVDHCLINNYKIIPGCSTPSDMEQAIERDISTVKFFPAEQSGGLEYIKAVSAPYNMLKFMPTGGINESNIGKYLAFDKIIACGGSWMVPKDLIDKGEFEKIEQLCKNAVKAAGVKA